jgi:GWxTD domain-containing protein
VNNPFYKLTHFFLLAALAVCLASCFRPLQDQDIARSLVRRADSLRVARQSDAAKREYRRALEFDEASVEALSGLGRLLADEQSWQSAIGWFERILKYDRENFDAHYNLGCCYREQGRERYYLEKMLSLFKDTGFEKAQEHFRWILSRDSLYSDVLYQSALVHLYRHDYEDAIATALRQVELKPALRHGPNGLFRIYREYIATQESNSPPALVANPVSDYDKFFRADWERRKGMLVDAERDLLVLMEAPGIVPTQMISQSLARLKAKQGHEDTVETLIRESTVRIKTLGDADLVFEDLKYIVTDDELQRYRALQSVDETRTFFLGFWGKRNPNPILTTNVRIAEHYRRLVYAEENYQAFGPKTFAKNAGNTWLLNFPQSYNLNEEFNDKGIVYMHHGKPDETISTPSESLEKNESWLYHSREETPEMLFDFHVMEGARVTEWRLVPMFANPALWTDRSMFSQRYARMAMAPGDASQTSTTQRLLLEGMEEGKKTVSSGLLADGYKRGSDAVMRLESPIAVTSYRGKNGKTAVDLSYVISPSEVKWGIRDTLRPLRIDAEYSMHNSAWKRVADDQRTKFYNPRSGRGKSAIEVFHLLVPPDSYFVAWQAKLLDGNVLISQKLQARVDDFSGSALAMSDVELAYTIEPAKEGSDFNKGSLLVVPNPLRKYMIDKLVYVYFEAYNLVRNAEGRTNYTIEYELNCLTPQTSFLERVLGFGKKSSVTVRSPRQGTGEWSQENVALDVHQLEPGHYDLRVRLTDVLRQRTVSRSVQLELYEGE